METKLIEINVTLSDRQKEEIFKAFFNRKRILLELENDALTGNNTLLVPSKLFELGSFNFGYAKGTAPDLREWKKKYLYVRGLKTFSKWKEYNLEAIDEELFSEMWENDFFLVPSKNDEGMTYYRVDIPPTINESLEEARKNNKGMQIILDYSTLTDSIGYSVFKNIGKLMEDLPSLRI